MHGRNVRQLYAERRLNRDVAVIEAKPGVAIVIAAWMLDPVVCPTMSLGSPAVDITGLADLDRLLRALGLRRACFAEAPSKEEVHHANTAAPGCPRQAAPAVRHGAGLPRVERDDSHDRSIAGGHLACLLMEASGVDPKEIGDDER
jgi:hypothetical protein